MSHPNLNSTNGPHGCFIRIVVTAPPHLTFPDSFSLLCAPRVPHGSPPWTLQALSWALWAPTKRDHQEGIYFAHLWPSPFPQCTSRLWLYDWTWCLWYYFGLRTRIIKPLMYIRFPRGELWHISIYNLFHRLWANDLVTGAHCSCRPGAHRQAPLP